MDAAARRKPNLAGVYANLIEVLRAMNKGSARTTHRDIEPKSSVLT